MNTLKIDLKDQYAIVQLDRGKANPINAEMVRELSQTFTELADNKAVKGVILTGKENFFSAGLDVIELYGYDEPTMNQFWGEFATMVATLTAFPKPFIAAITGYSPAGGCVLAVCADYRVMASGKYHIGLNEVPVGIIVPETIFRLYAFWIGEGKAYQNLMEGKLMGGEEALASGLVNELVEADQVVAQAEAKMKQYLTFEQEGWKKTKRNLRHNLLELMKNENFERYMKPTAQHWWSPQARFVMGKVVESLKK